MNNFEMKAEENTEVEKPNSEKKREMLTDEDFDLVVELQNRIVDFAENLKKKHPDYEDYELFHLLAGSTVRGECPRVDFPGEDSIEAFINHLYQEFLKRKGLANG